MTHPDVRCGAAEDGNQRDVDDGSRAISIIAGRSSLAEEQQCFELDAPDGYGDTAP